MTARLSTARPKIVHPGEAGASRTTLPANVIPLFGRSGTRGANRRHGSGLTYRLHAVPARQMHRIAVRITWRSSVAFPVDSLVITS